MLCKFRKTDVDLNNQITSHRETSTRFRKVEGREGRDVMSTENKAIEMKWRIALEIRMGAVDNFKVSVRNMDITSTCNVPKILMHEAESITIMIQ